MAKKFATLEIFWQIFMFFWAGNPPKIPLATCNLARQRGPNFTLIRESCRPCGVKNRKIGHLSNFNTGGCPAGKDFVKMCCACNTSRKLALQTSVTTSHVTCCDTVACETCWSITVIWSCWMPVWHEECWVCNKSHSSNLLGFLYRRTFGGLGITKQLWQS